MKYCYCLGTSGAVGIECRWFLKALASVDSIVSAGSILEHCSPAEPPALWSELEPVSFGGAQVNQHVFSWLTAGARASFEFEREPCLPCSPSPAGLGGSLEKFGEVCVQLQPWPGNWHGDSLLALCA